MKLTKKICLLAVVLIGLTLLAWKVTFNRCDIKKCLNDICVGDKVIVEYGIYKNECGKVWDVDNGGYFVSFCNGDGKYYSQYDVGLGEYVYKKGKKRKQEVF